MKNFHHLTKGVTLLEVMLVLTIISIIIVASMRYYKTASDNSQAQAAASALQAIAGAADTYALQNTAAGYTNLATTNLPTYLANTAWGGALTISGTPSARSFGIAYGSISTSMCNTLVGMLSNSKWGVGSCPASSVGSGSVTFTYTN